MSGFLSILGRALLSDASTAARSALRESLDADPSRLARIAEHRLLVPVLRLMQGETGGARPWLPELRADAVNAVESSLAQTVLLGEVIRAFDDAKLPVLAWKGPALSLLAWGDSASRTYADLDLVVRQENFADAERVLERLGWRRRGELSSRQAHAVQRWLAATEWTDGAGAGRLLELHTDFSAPRFPGRLSVASVFSRAERLELAGVAMRVPNAADTLALLAQHGTKHGWTVLEELVTFARLAQRSPDALLEGFARAQSVGGERAVLLAVRLLHRVLDIAPPSELQAALGRWTDGARLEAKVIERLATDQTGWHPTLAWSLAWTARPGDRLRLVSSSLFAPTQQEWEAIRLPDGLVGLYPLVRIVRLGWKRIGGQKSEVRGQ